MQFVGSKKNTLFGQSVLTVSDKKVCLLFVPYYTHIHTHIYTHIYTHTHIHTHIHTYTHTYTHM